MESTSKLIKQWKHERAKLAKKQDDEITDIQKARRGGEAHIHELEQALEAARSDHKTQMTRRESNLDGIITTIEHRDAKLQRDVIETGQEFSYDPYALRSHQTGMGANLNDPNAPQLYVAMDVFARESAKRSEAVAAEYESRMDRYKLECWRWQQSADEQAREQGRIPTPGFTMRVKKVLGIAPVRPEHPHWGEVTPAVSEAA